MTEGVTADPKAVVPDTVRRVRDEWIDYNGHLNEGYYAVLFSHAVDDVLDCIGADEQYRRDTDCAVFSVEAHIRYLRQVRAGSTVEIRNRIVAADSKRLITLHEMYIDGTLCATEEVLGLHVAGQSESVVEFPEVIRDGIELYLDPGSEHRQLSVGRSR